MRNCCSTFYFYAILFSIFGSLTNWTLHAQKFVDKVESRHNDYLNIKNSNYSGRTHHLESVDPSRSGLVEWSRTCKYVWGLKPRGQRRGRGLSEEEVSNCNQQRFVFIIIIRYVKSFVRSLSLFFLDSFFASDL